MHMYKRTLNESAIHRWGIMILVSITMAANYYFYDALSPLKDLLEDIRNFSSSDYGLFVSAYSVPNVFLAMAVVGGIILDRIGIRITGFVFVFFMVVGAAITAYGSSDYFNTGGFGYDFMNSFLVKYSPALKVMYLGFFLFGLGAETSIVVISKIIVKWFKGKELALALGMNLAIARGGMAAALIISPKLQGLTWPIWLGTIFLAIGLLAFLVYIIYDIKIDKQLKGLDEEEEEPFRLSDIGKLLTNRSFIFIALLCVTFYSAVFPFVKYAPDLLINKFSVSRETAGFITSLLPFGTIVFTPLFGYICDTKGKSASLMILGSLLLISVHLIFALTSITPYIPMFILGIGFSLVPAAMWPSVAKIVDQRRIGSAYGLMFSIQNIGLWAFPMIIGMVLDFNNPAPSTTLTEKDFRRTVLIDKPFEATYMNRKDLFIPDYSMKVNVNIYTDSIDGELIWSEYHNVVTDAKGSYSLDVLKGNEIFYVDINNLAFEGKDFNYQLIDLLNDSAIISKGHAHIINDSLIVNKHIRFEGKQRYKVLLNIFHAGSNELAWKERFNGKSKDNGSIDIVLSKGVLSYADPDIFDWTKEDYFIEIKTPLDYTNTILMLAFLGVLGLLFAFLLLREDKTSGYGLELPNKTDEKE